MKEMEISADIMNLEKVILFIDTGLEDSGYHLNDMMMFHVAVEEIYSNIVFYAYPKPPGSVKIRWDLDKSNGQALLQFWDRGIPYDPLKKPDPDITLSAEERQIGGLGIFIVKESMDQVTYEYVDGCNVLTLKKTFHKVHSR